MSLEAYTGLIKDLVITNPNPTDPKSQGDDHLRGIKKTIFDDALRKSGDTMTGGLSISKTAVTAPAAADGNVFSGTYTPTFSAASNTATPTLPAGAWSYMRVGNTVTVSGYVQVNPTTVAAIGFEATLPVPAVSTSFGALAGSFVSQNNTIVGAASLNGTTKNAAFSATATATGARNCAVQFTYRVTA